MTGFLTVGQTAKRLKVTRQTVHQMIRDGRLRGAVWMLERWAIPEVEVDRLAAEREIVEPEAA